MKRIVLLLLAVSAALFLCVLAFVFAQLRLARQAEKEVADEQEQALEQTENRVAEDPSSAEGQTVAADPKDVSVAGNASVAESGAATKPAASSAEEKVADGKNVASLQPAAVPAAEQESASSAGTAKTEASAKSDAVAAKPSGNPSGKPENAAVSAELASTATPKPASGAARPGATPENTHPAIRLEIDDAGKDPADAASASGSYQYFEYQVIAVPKKTLAAAAESMQLPKDSIPTDELLPAIYKAGGYRVIGYSAGYSAANEPVAFKMSRTEFFPDFFIMPKSPSDSGNDPSAQDKDEDDADDEDSGDDGSDDGGEDGEDSEDEEDDDESDGDFINSYNNLAGVFPFFGGSTPTGNEFYLDIRPPRLFALDSTMRKLNGFSNTDYGDWGRAQTPVFDENSFASAVSATKGKPMIIARASSSNTWTLHVFFTRALPPPEKTTPLNGSENKLVKLDFQIVRAKWTDVCAAGSSDGSPAVPSDDFMQKIMKSSQLRDLYSPSFRLIPSQEPVSLQLNTRTSFVPLKWIPAQDPGIPAIPLGNESIWTGTALQAAARILSDGKTVRLDYSFEKTTQTGWRNYPYSYFGNPEDEADDFDPMQNRYARPQRSTEPVIRSGLLKLPMLDTTAFRQTLFLEAGKPVLAARISNPAYQPDMLTMLFVTATIEDTAADAE